MVHLVRKFVNSYKNYFIINIDNLTYASNYESIIDLETNSNYKFIKGDIRNREIINKIFMEFKIDSIIHLAESHVDNSIENPLLFVQTNILGTINLLEEARLNWNKPASKFVLRNFTDEVYGSLGKEGFFRRVAIFSQITLFSI